jgi:hypothetical protein
MQEYNVIKKKREKEEVNKTEKYERMFIGYGMTDILIV